MAEFANASGLVQVVGEGALKRTTNLLKLQWRTTNLLLQGCCPNSEDLGIMGMTVVQLHGTCLGMEVLSVILSKPLNTSILTM